MREKAGQRLWSTNEKKQGSYAWTWQSPELCAGCGRTALLLHIRSSKPLLDVFIHALKLVHIVVRHTCCISLGPYDTRGDQDDQLGPAIDIRPVTEEPADKGDPAQKRYA